MYGAFIGKGYESGGLFRLSFSDACLNYVNHVSHDNETNVWHSLLCHINFGCMAHLASMVVRIKRGSGCTGGSGMVVGIKRGRMF
jgi:hypothetical protein